MQDQGYDIWKVVVCGVLTSLFLAIRALLMSSGDKVCLLERRMNLSASWMISLRRTSRCGARPSAASLDKVSNCRLSATAWTNGGVTLPISVGTDLHARHLKCTQSLWTLCPVKWVRCEVTSVLYIF